MLESYRDEIAHMVVGEPIDGARTFTSIRDEAPVPQQAELMADAGLADSRNLSEIAHAQFLNGERVEDTKSRGVGKRREQRGSALGSALVGY